MGVTKEKLTGFMIKRVRGTQDILPQDSYSWQEIEQIARRIFSLYGYQEIRTPILEEASLFNRSLGETTEIVQKQMFEIRRGKDHLVLRPEVTAPVVRAYLENNLDNKRGTAKFYYFGPMFRAERPQKGRLRQFHHLGVEAIGSLSPFLDVEVISLSNTLLNKLGINQHEILLNSLGCSDDKARLAKELHKGLRVRLRSLCTDCQDRFNRNIFRILDCKNPSCQKVINSLGMGQDCLCPDCSQHFKKVTEGLRSVGVDYQLSPSLVRGLDYYTRTVFEIRHSRLGAQDALGAGGRYDNLVQQLGGNQCGAMGFALGVERILLAQDAKSRIQRQNQVYIITLGEEADKKGGCLLDSLRQNNICADMDYGHGRSLKAKMREANSLGVRYCIIIGEDEIKKGVFSLRNMESAEQKEVTEAGLLDLLSHNSSLITHNS